MKVGRTIEEFAVGQKCEFSRKFTAKDVALMAELIGDHNPFHIAGEFATKSRFGAPIIHGWLVGGMICHFGGDLYPGPGCIAEKIELSFLKPVYFDETIRAVCTILDVNVKRRRIKFGMECFNEKGEKVVEGSAIGLPTQMEVTEMPVGAVRPSTPIDLISRN